VATVFTRAPWVRTPEQVAESLFRIQRHAAADGQNPPHPENQRVGASLLQGKTAVIQEVAQEMQRRDPKGIKTRVALTDGDRALQILVEGTLRVRLLLDLLHVLEKLWKAAYVFHAEGSLEAELWVLDRTLRILFGEVSQVVKGIRQSVTKRRLFGAKRKTLCGIADSLHPIALVCAMTNTSAGPSPVARSRARARTSSRIAWSVPECAGLRRWPRPSSNSEPST